MTIKMGYRESILMLIVIVYVNNTCSKSTN